MTDREGQSVMDLTAEDFEIFEEDKEQEVASFQVIDHLVERDVSPPVPVATDVGTNRLPENGRLYVVVLDGLHTSPRLSPRSRRIARIFIEQYVGSEDMAAIVTTSGGQAAQSFTTNRDLLVEAIDKFQGERLPSPFLEEAQQRAAGQGRRSPLTADIPIAGNPLSLEERALRGHHMLQTLRGIAELLAGDEGRRKAIVLVSEGIDFDLYGLSETNIAGPAIFAETLHTVGELAQSNIAIYCIDPSGLSRGDWGGADSRQAVNPTKIHAERHQRQDNLRTLSGETGGVAFLNQNDYEGGLKQVVEDTSRYYLLGYYPTNQEQDGEYRKIRVEVKRSGLSVRARKGYVAGSPEEAEGSETAEEDLFNAIELSEIPLRVSAGALKLGGPNARVPVVVEMGIDGFKFSEEEGRLQDRVELAAVLLDQEGQVVTSETRMLDIAVSTRVRDLLRRHGFRAVTGFDVSPGDYQLRVMVREEGGQKKGTVFFDLEVPVCDGTGLTMGGVFVGSMQQSFIPVSIEPEEKEQFDFVPSTERRFAPDDELLVQTEVCSSGEALVVETDIRDSNGGILSRDERTYESEEVSVVHRARLPLDDLGPGSYVLHLTVRDPSSGHEWVRRTAFEISP